jgi:hypothetical protein
LSKREDRRAQQFRQLQRQQTIEKQRKRYESQKLDPETVKGLRDASKAMEGSMAQVGQSLKKAIKAQSGHAIPPSHHVLPAYTSPPFPQSPGVHVNFNPAPFFAPPQPTTLRCPSCHDNVTSLELSHKSAHQGGICRACAMSFDDANNPDREAAFHERVYRRYLINRSIPVVAALSGV